MTKIAKKIKTSHRLPDIYPLATHNNCLLFCIIIEKEVILLRSNYPPKGPNKKKRVTIYGRRKDIVGR